MFPYIVISTGGALDPEWRNLFLLIYIITTNLLIHKKTLPPKWWEHFQVSTAVTII